MSVSFNMLENTVLYFGQDVPVSEMMSPAIDTESDFWRRIDDYDCGFTERDTSWITQRSKSRLLSMFTRNHPFVTPRSKARKKHAKKKKMKSGLEIPKLRRSTNSVLFDEVQHVRLEWETICDITATAM